LDAAVLEHGGDRAAEEARRVVNWPDANGCDGERAQVVLGRTVVSLELDLPQHGARAAEVFR